MKFFSNIPRGLVIFLAGIFILIATIAGYEFLAAGNSSSPTSTAGGGFFSSLFPFGNSSNTTSGNGSGSQGPLTQTQSGEVPVLRQVSRSPVSGGWFAAGPASTSPPMIRYMDRASGHITETSADSLTENRISNTTMPGIEELYAAGDSALIGRYIGDNGNVQNLFGLINATSSVQSFTTSPLRRFDRVAVERGGNMLTVASANGGSRAELSKPDGSKLQTVFASFISSWVPLIGGGRTFLETAPSAAALGYVYELKGGSLIKISPGMPGLTAIVSPSGNYVAYSGNGPNGFSLLIFNNANSEILTTAIHALAIKCAWIQNSEPLLFCAVPTDPAPGAYPDDWLLGNISFSDDAWIINPAKSVSYYIGSLVDSNNGTIDAENISVDPTGSYALFMNKKDLSLWSLNIAGVVAHAKSQ